MTTEELSEVREWLREAAEPVNLNESYLYICKVAEHLVGEVEHLRSVLTTIANSELSTDEALCDLSDIIDLAREALGDV